jgi:hypothetical protein
MAKVAQLYVGLQQLIPNFNWTSRLENMLETNKEALYSA